MPLPHKYARRGLGAEKQAFQVDVHDLVPDRFVQFVLVPFVDEQARDVDVRVVDDAVQTAEMPDRATIASTLARSVTLVGM